MYVQISASWDQLLPSSYTRCFRITRAMQVIDFALLWEGFLIAIFHHRI